jgi:hypothetical protein
MQQQPQLMQLPQGSPPQNPATTDQNRERRGFHKRAAYILGILQIAFGSASIVLAAINIALENGVYQVGYGIWCGIFVSNDLWGFRLLFHV